MLENYTNRRVKRIVSAAREQIFTPSSLMFILTSKNSKGTNEFHLCLY